MVEKHSVFCERRRYYPDGYTEILASNKNLWGGFDVEYISPENVEKPAPPVVEISERYYEEMAEKMTDYGYLCCTEGTGVDALDELNRAKPQRVPDKAANTLRACRRAAGRIRELSHCAEFRYFVTLTLDGSKVDRYDAAQIVRKMSTWCDNQVRRRGLKYVLVPERHKDGAVHFHGFFNDALPVVDSGTISRKGHKKPSKPRSKAERARWIAEGGHVVYNLPSWSWGFTTAIELYGDYNAAVAYTCKYLTKQVVNVDKKTGEVTVGEKVGGRWFYHGGEFAMYRDEYGFYGYLDYLSYLENPPDDRWRVAEFGIPDTDISFIKVSYWRDNGERRNFSD